MKQQGGGEMYFTNPQSAIGFGAEEGGAWDGGDLISGTSSKLTWVKTSSMSVFYYYLTALGLR